MGVLGGGLGPNVLSGGIDAAVYPTLLPPLQFVTLDDIHRMTQALASPERQVTLGNQTITYRSVDDLMKARALLIDLYNAQTNLALGKKPRSKRSYAYQDGRGYD